MTTTKTTTLLDRRKELRLSRADVEKQLGGKFSQAQISRIELGAGKTTEDETKLVADAIEKAGGVKADKAKAKADAKAAAKAEKAAKSDPK